ncbi:hypothetical protein WBJ53_29425 [Spirosoma sp. SC4-14]|uniref:hypothetical protein n=1 Tax=Spirosoma sp. SC4-14 TaxID=3128900 RepID=UPI0030CC97A2
MIEAIFSPDQSYKVEFSVYEMRMSHWIEKPYLVRVGNDEVVFSLESDPWSASNVHWVDNETVEMYLRKYPGRVACRVRLTPSANYGSASNETQSHSGTLTEVSNWILTL